MSGAKSLESDVIEIGNEDFMINKGSHFAGSHIMHTVQVRYVHRSFVGSGVLFIVFINIQAEQYDVDSIQALEHHDALAPKGKLRRIILERIPFFHPFSHF